MDAITEIVGALERAEAGNHHLWDIVLMVGVDIRNAFNSERWTDFLMALLDTFKSLNT